MGTLCRHLSKGAPSRFSFLNCLDVTVFKSQILSLALNYQKMSEVDPELSLGPENRLPRMQRQFPSLWDYSRNTKSTKQERNMVSLGSASFSRLVS